MFENIIGYSKLTGHLTELILKRELPQVMLIAGSPLSGKQTLATEVARALLCTEKADWYCSCSHCKNSKLLTHPDMSLMGQIYGMNEVFLAKELLLNHHTKREMLFFLKSIFKILRRADMVIWEMSDVWNRNIRTPAEVLRELLLNYQDIEQNWYDTKQINALVSATEKLYRAFPQQMLPVQNIRNIITWSGMGTSSMAKVIIINEIERMLPASANMMLKTLEEPSEKVYFILLSNNPNAILPTIRSRTRKFMLPQRTREDEIKVLGDIFQYKTDDAVSLSKGVKLFFDGYGESNFGIEDEDRSSIQKIANEYFQAILHQKQFYEDYITFPSKQNKELRDYGLTFLSYLTINISELFCDNKIISYFISNMWKKCERARDLIQHKNISVNLVLEDLFYSLKEDYGKIY